MAISRINKLTFDRLKSAPSTLGRLTHKEVDWFVDESETVIGVVAEHRLSRDWGYVVLERDEQGVFRVCAQTSGVHNREEASYQLLRTMNAVESMRREYCVK